MEIREDRLVFEVLGILLFAPPPLNVSLATPLKTALLHDKVLYSGILIDVAGKPGLGEWAEGTKYQG